MPGTGRINEQVIGASAVKRGDQELGNPATAGDSEGASNVGTRGTVKQQGLAEQGVSTGKPLCQVRVKGGGARAAAGHRGGQGIQIDELGGGGVDQERLGFQQ